VTSPVIKIDSLNESAVSLSLFRHEALALCLSLREKKERISRFDRRFARFKKEARVVRRCSANKARLVYSHCPFAVMQKAKNTVTFKRRTLAGNTAGENLRVAGNREQRPADFLVPIGIQRRMHGKVKRILAGGGCNRVIGTLKREAERIPAVGNERLTERRTRP